MKLKTFYVRAAAAAAAALLFLYPFPAHAADSAALQGQVSAAQREYESAASTLDSMQQQASDTRQQVNDLQSQTDALRGQLGSIVAQLEQSRTELAEAQNQATAAAKALEEKQAAFSARYDSCKQQLTAMQLLNEGGEISLLMQADDLYELLTFWQVLNDLTEHNKQLLDELDAEAQALDTQRQQSVDVKRLTEELIAHYRALMLAALPGGQALLSGVSPEEEAQYLEKGPQLGQREAIRAIRTLGTALEHMTRGSDQRIELELALFSLSEPPQQRQTVPVQAAPVARAAQPAAVQPFASAPAVQPFVSAPVQQAPVQQPVVEPAPLPEMPQPAAEPVQSAPEPTQAPASVQVPVQAEELPPLPEEPPVQGGEALPWEEPSAPARPVPPPREEPSPAPQTTAPAPKQEAAPAQPRPAAGSLAPYPEWAQITQKLQEVDPMLYSYLRKSKAYFDGTRVLIDGGKTFRDFIRANKDSQRLIKKLILQVSGKAIPIGPYEPRTAGKAVSNAEQSLHALEKLGLDVSIEDTARKQK